MRLSDYLPEVPIRVVGFHSTCVAWSKSMGAGVQGVLRSTSAALRKQQPVPILTPLGGRFGLPADFLPAPDGGILRCKYGSRANDRWSVDEILTLARGTLHVSEAEQR